MTNRKKKNTSAVGVTGQQSADARRYSKETDRALVDTESTEAG